MGGTFYGKPSEKENKAERVGIFQRLKNTDENIRPKNKPQNAETQTDDKNAEDEDIEEENAEDEYVEEKDIKDIIREYANKKLLSYYTNEDNNRVHIDGRKMYRALKELANGNITQDRLLNNYYNQLDDFVNTVVQLRKKNLSPRKKELKNFRDDVRTAINRLMNIPPLEGMGFKKSKKLGSGIKILTPKQMLTRLPKLLAQVEAGNNSQKLKNEIRQLLYSLYRSKKMNKTVYKNLMETV